MRISVWIESKDPPAGWVVADHVDVRFSGWLGLMRALSDVLGSDVFGSTDPDLPEDLHDDDEGGPNELPRGG